MLEAANGGATMTKIMYKAFLSYAQLKNYLAILVENGLISNDGDGTYKTTSKGIRYLEMTRNMDGLFQMSSETIRR
jgi:predicted transcriptional regulator